MLPELFLSLFLAALSIFFVLQKWKNSFKGKRKQEVETYHTAAQTAKNKMRSVKRYNHFHVPLPYLDGLYTLYLIRKYGISAVDRLTENMEPDDIYEMPVGPYNILLSKDATVLQKVFSSTEPGHLSRPEHIYSRVFVDALENGLLRTPFERWNQQRKIISRAFTFRTYPSYAEIMNKHGKSLAQELSHLALKNNNGIGEIRGEKMLDCIHKNVLKILMEFIMGSEFIGCDEAVQYSKDFWEIKEIVMERFLSVKFYVPFVWWFHPKRKRYEVLLKSMHALGKTIIEHYENKVESNKDLYKDENDTVNRNLIEEMLKHNVPSEEIFAEIGTFIVAGYETVGVAMLFILHHLACHPEYQARCRAEVDEVMDQSDDLKLENLSKLEYLERFIMESLRIHPPPPFVLRELSTPLTLDDGVTLKKGSIVNLSPWLIHHNPRYYPEPEVFDPDRFLPEEVKKRESGTFLTFSGGLRNCIGRRFAILEMKAMVAWILRNFEVHTEERGLHDVRLFLEATLRPEREFRTVLRLRNVSMTNINVNN